jgi:hypothetical protein
MKVEVHKKVLSEISILHGLVRMPKNFEIDRRALKESIVYGCLISKKPADLNTFYLPYPRYFVNYTKATGILNSFLMEYIFLKHKLVLRNVDIWGNVYLPNESIDFIKHIDPLNLRDSPDYIMIYGVDINDKGAKITFSYDNNRKKNREFKMSLMNNQFIMFPSTLSHKISKNSSKEPNTILTISYIDAS